MRIAVLTSGGDSAGMNAAVRSAVKCGILKSVLVDFRCTISSSVQRMRDVRSP